MAQSNSWKLARGKTFRPRVPGLPSNGCVNGKPLLSVQMVAALEDVLTPRVQRLGIKAAAALPAATAGKLSRGPLRVARSLLLPTRSKSLTPRRDPENILA